MRKLVLMAAAGLAIMFAAPASAAPAAQPDAVKRAAAAIGATAEVQHWRWGSRGGGHWRWGSGGHWRWGSRGRGGHWRWGSRGGHWRWGSGGHRRWGSRRW